MAETEMKYVHAKRHHGHGGKHHHNAAQKPHAQQPSGNKTPETAKGKFNFDTIHGMQLKEVVYDVPPISLRKQRRSEFNKIRGAFLRHLAETQADLLVERLGLSEGQIAAMREGKTPNGFNVHHKLPLHGGGKNEFSNFILTPLYPHDQWHKDIIEKQADGIGTAKVRKILIPWTDEMIYDPKKYGFFRDGKQVDPGYTSKVDPNAEHYMKNWLPEHVAAIRNKNGKPAAPEQGKKNTPEALLKAALAKKSAHR